MPATSFGNCLVASNWVYFAPAHRAIVEAQHLLKPVKFRIDDLVTVPLHDQAHQPGEPDFS
jgi:hypothetical protein